MPTKTAMRVTTSKPKAVRRREAHDEAVNPNALGAIGESREARRRFRCFSNLPWQFHDPVKRWWSH